MTLKEWSKVKSDLTKIFAAYGFLNIDCTLQTCATKKNNKRDISTFMLSCLCLTLKEWSKFNSDTTKRFAIYAYYS